jgi:hypothetical protein
MEFRKDRIHLENGGEHEHMPASGNVLPWRQSDTSQRVQQHNAVSVTVPRVFGFLPRRRMASSRSTWH